MNLIRNYSKSRVSLEFVFIFTSYPTNRWKCFHCFDKTSQNGTKEGMDTSIQFDFSALQTRKPPNPEVMQSLLHGQNRKHVFPYNIKFLMIIRSLFKVYITFEIYVCRGSVNMADAGRGSFHIRQYKKVILNMQFIQGWQAEHLDLQQCASTHPQLTASSNFITLPPQLAARAECLCFKTQRW